MPYIENGRPEMDEIVDLMVKKGVQANGDLNYILFKFCKYHVDKRYNAIKNFRGEIIETWAEIGRRILAPYEDEKIDSNHDHITKNAEEIEKLKNKDGKS